jgi:hypothetical protein
VRTVKIILEYVLAVVLIALLLFSITSVVLVKFYGEDLQSYVIREINTRLDSKVDVERMAVRIFRKFPGISIELGEITVWSSHNFNTGEFAGPGADTLLTAETVNVSFNPVSLIRKIYNIRQLEIKNGILHLYTDPSGEGNYRLLAASDRKDGSKKQIDVGQLKVSNFQIVLNNRAKQLISSGVLDQLQINGRFSRRNTRIRGDLKGSLDMVSNKGIIYASGREIRARINLDVNDSVYILNAGQLQIDRIVADTDGRFVKDPSGGIRMDLYAAARDLNIHEVLDLLPGSMSSPLSGIRGNGTLQLYARATGVASSTLTPQIEADFQTSNANLNWDRVPFPVRNLNITGTYSNGGKFNPVTTSLHIENVSCSVGDDHISGEGVVTNFYDPDFSFELKGDIHPGQWIRWYEKIPLREAGGIIYSDLKVKGSYDRLKPRGERFIAFDIGGNVRFEDLMARFADRRVSLSDLNGSIRIENDFWEPSLSGEFGRSDFSIEGTGLNLISFLIDRDEELVASVTLRSERMDLQEILDQLPGTRSGKDEAIQFPGKLNLRLDFAINEFSKDKLLANNVRGIAIYDAPFLRVDSLHMETMEGTLGGEFGMIQDQEGVIHTNVNADLHHLDIHRLFLAFNDFGQSHITHEHLEGNVSGTSSFSASFSDDFSIQTETILSENDLTISSGELNGFKPLMALSRFIQVEELKHIRFETLENTILIRDNRVVIPAMDIHSNALNLSASGSHGFDHRYDYRLRLLLSELLYNKAKKSANAEFSIAEDATDTRTLFLKVYDTGSGAMVEVDREKTAEKIRNDLKAEKTELKAILNKELGLFKHDTAIGEIRTGEGDRQELFRFELPEEVDTVEAEKPAGEKQRWWRRGTRADTAVNKPVGKFVIDE